MENNMMKVLQEFAKAIGFSAPKSIPQIAASLISSVLSFLGVIFLILIIYGGFIYMTAGGSEEKVSRAKKIIFDAMIGLVIVLSSYAISYFVIQALTKATGTN